MFAKFLKRDIICRYRIPERIIIDNAPNFNDNQIQRLCENFKIEHQNSTSYRPKMNGVVEAADKNIKKSSPRWWLITRIDMKCCNVALCSIRSSHLYGMEVVSPIEVEISS